MPKDSSSGVHLLCDRDGICGWSKSPSALMPPAALHAKVAIGPGSPTVISVLFDFHLPLLSSMSFLYPSSHTEFSSKAGQAFLPRSPSPSLL